MQVLIVKSSSLGDIVHSLPAVMAFKELRPEVQIDWLVEKRWAEILHDHPSIRRLVVMDSHAPRKKPLHPSTYLDFVSTISNLRRVHYDAAIDLQRLTKSAVLMGLTRAKRRYGFDWKSCREPAASLLLNRKATIDYDRDPIRSQYLKPLSLVANQSLQLPSGPCMWADQRATDSLAAKFDQWPNPPYGVILTGAAFGTKVWPTNHWGKIAARLARHMPVVLPWAGDSEKGAVEAVARLAPGVTISPAMSLKEMSALLDRAQMVVGGDTGPLHLAAALGRPTLSIYGPTLATRNAPPGHISLQSPVDCTGCVKRICPKKNPDCLTAISPDSVWEKLEELL